MGSDKYIITHLHHCGVVLGVFAMLSILCPLACLFIFFMWTFPGWEFKMFVRPTWFRFSFYGSCHRSNFIHFPLAWHSKDFFFYVFSWMIYSFIFFHLSLWSISSKVLCRVWGLGQCLFCVLYLSACSSTFCWNAILPPWSAFCTVKHQPSIFFAGLFPGFVFSWCVRVSLF